MDNGMTGVLAVILALIVIVTWPPLAIIFFLFVVIALIVNRVSERREAKFKKELEEKWGKDHWVTKL